MMRNAAAFVLCLLGTAGCEWGPLSLVEKTVTASRDLAPGSRVLLEGFNGSVDVHGWDQDRVELSGVIRAPTQEDLDQLELVLDEREGELAIRTRRPEMLTRGGVRYSVRIPRRTTLARVRTSNGAVSVEDLAGDARLSTSNAPVRIDRVRGSVEVETTNAEVEAHEVEGSLILRTTNGAVRARDVRGGFSAYTTNGGIDAQLEGAPQPVALETSNGPVALVLAEAPSSEVRISTRNGGITVRLHDRTGATVRAFTSNARVTSDFAIEGRVTSDPDRLEGVLGGGGAMLSLRTTNGPIRLLRL